MIYYLNYFEKILNLLENKELSLRIWTTNLTNNFFYIWLYYIYLNIIYSLFIFFINIFYILFILLNIIGFYNNYKQDKTNIYLLKKKIIFRFFDFLLFCILWYYFNIKFIFVFFFIKILVFWFSIFRILLTNLNDNFFDNINYIKEQIILKNIRFIVEKNKKIKEKLLIIVNLNKKL